jgi:hypothetical protein
MCRYASESGGALAVWAARGLGGRGGRGTRSGSGSAMMGSPAGTCTGDLSLLLVQEYLLY